MGLDNPGYHDRYGSFPLGAGDVDGRKGGLGMLAPIHEESHGRKGELAFLPDSLIIEKTLKPLAKKVCLAHGTHRGLIHEKRLAVKYPFRYDDRMSAFSFPQSLQGLRIHMVGVKGTGMAALAEILVSRGPSSPEATSRTPFTPTRS
jgi:hypothetical protein